MSYKVTFDQTRRTLPWKLDILANVAGRRLRYFYPMQGQAWSDGATDFGEAPERRAAWAGGK